VDIVWTLISAICYAVAVTVQVGNAAPTYSWPQFLCVRRASVQAISHTVIVTVALRGQATTSPRDKVGGAIAKIVAIRRAISITVNVGHITSTNAGCSFVWIRWALVLAIRHAVCVGVHI
jgi:hypothetical protein